MRHGKERGILIISLLLALPIPSRAQTLLNTSFEDAETVNENPFGDLAAHWGRWGNWMNRESVWTPTRNGKCMMAYHHWQIEEDTTSGVFQDIPGTAAGGHVAFSVCVYKDPKTNADSIELRIEKLNGNGLVATRTYTMAEISTGTWDKLSVSGANAEAGVRVLISVKPKQGGGREGCLKLDDASLTPAAAPAKAP
jgi:hypothetical protein